MIFSANREDSGLIMDGTAYDVEAVEDPDAKNFIGFYKPFQYTQPALGDIEHIRKFRNHASQHLFQAPIQVGFHLYGRPTLRPMDIIGIYHTDPPNLEYIVHDDPNYLKYRILTVSGSIDYTDEKWQYRTDVVAQHI